MTAADFQVSGWNRRSGRWTGVLVRGFLSFLAASAFTAALLALMIRLNPEGAPVLEVHEPARVIWSDPALPREAPAAPAANATAAPPAATMTVALDAARPAALSPVPLKIGAMAEFAAEPRGVSTGTELGLPRGSTNLAPGLLQGNADLLIQDRVDRAPRELANALPVYPRAARTRGQEGVVSVRLLIDEQGQVAEAQLDRVTGEPAFGEAVLNAARDWRFEPARHRGRAVRIWGIKTVRFQLTGSGQ